MITLFPKIIYDKRNAMLFSKTVEFLQLLIFVFLSLLCQWNFGMFDIYLFKIFTA